MPGADNEFYNDSIGGSTIVSLSSKMILKKLRPGSIPLRYTRDIPENFDDIKDVSDTPMMVPFPSVPSKHHRMKVSRALIKLFHKLNWLKPHSHSSPDSKSTKTHSKGATRSKESCTANNPLGWFHPTVSIHPLETSINESYESLDTFAPFSPNFDGLDSMIFSPTNHRPSISDFPSIDHCERKRGNDLSLGASLVSETIALSFTDGTTARIRALSTKSLSPIINSTLKGKSPHVNFASPLIRNLTKKVSQTS